jgi:fructan beta-fructosidase
MSYHFSPPSGWMNDPNGLVYFDGEWHLFYQHNPDGETRQHWGHAVSRDLLHWEHLPIALYPDELGSIWSGSAVVDEHDTSGFFAGGRGLVAVFTYEKDGAQRQGLAFSRDRGRTWTKYIGNPVLTSPSPDFRDPKVFWHAPTDRWVMVVTAGRFVQFYHSSDLKNWTYASSFGEGWIPNDWVWECPDLFTLPADGDGGNPQWVLSASFIIPNKFEDDFWASKMRYLIGQFDGREFIPNPGDNQIGGHPISFGADDYAAITFANAPDNERILLGWMSNWVYAWPAHHAGKREFTTLPRRLALHRTPRGLRLFQQPLSPFETVRSLWKATPLGEETLSWSGQTGEAFALEAEFGAGSATEFGLRLRKGDAQQTTIGYDTVRQTVFVDRTQAGDAGFHPQFAARHEAPLVLPAGRLRLQVFVDICSVEVYANDGEVVLNDLIYPSPHSQGLEAYARGGTSHLVAVNMA